MIENIQDASNNQVITVKAVVKPTTNFFVRSMPMDFGVAVLGMKSKRCSSSYPTRPTSAACTRSSSTRTRRGTRVLLSVPPPPPQRSFRWLIIFSALAVVIARTGRAVRLFAQAENGPHRAHQGGGSPGTHERLCLSEAHIGKRERRLTGHAGDRSHTCCSASRSPDARGRRRRYPSTWNN